MQPISALKPAFTGGEFAPSLWERVDLQRYNSGCKTLRNFFVHPHGGASNRPGLQYIASAKYGNKYGRLVPFEFSKEQAYMIEFGEYYCRFYMNGGQIIAPTSTAAWASGVDYYIGDFVKVSDVIYRSKTNHTSNGTDHNTPPGNTTDWEESSVYEIETPYAETDLVGLKFVQSADVLYITSSDFYPRTLSRYSHISWRLELYPFEDGPFMSQNVTVKTITPSATTGTITLTASEGLFDILHVGALFKFDHYIEGQSYTGAFTGTGQGTAIKCGGTWRIITHGTWTGKIKVEKSTDGGTTWTTIRSFSSADDYNPNTYGEEDEERPFLVRINCHSYTSGTINVDLTTDAYTHVGIAKISDYTSATEVEAEVQEEIGLASATADWSEGAWSDYRGYPATVNFYQDRVVFASTKAEPQTTWGTKTSNYVNFGRSDPLVDSDGITVNLPSRKMNAIRHLVSLGKIIAFTSSSEWSIGPALSGIITPTSISQQFQGSRGSSEVTPEIIGNRIIFIQPKGSIVRDLVYDYATDGYTGDPLSLLSNHLFQNHSIVAMAYQAEPDSILWCLRNDGILLSLTYLREQEVVAWAWHDTDGDFESVACIPGDTYDEVWFIVKRGSQRFIERLTQRMVSTDPRDQFFVDCGISYDSPKTITGATKAEPVVITTSEAHGFSNGDLVDIRDVQGMAEINDLRYKVANATTYTFELTDEEDDTDIDGTAFSAYESGGEVRKAENTFSGLDHLEDKEVAILADGNVIDGITVESGSITLPVYASIVHVGLPYTADLETLNIEFNLASGTTQGKLLKVAQVQFYFLNSRGGWIGPDKDHLDEIVQRTNEPMGSPIVLYTGPHKQPITGDYKEGGNVFFRQIDPLPVTILAIIPKVTVGG
ncbi:MAG: hypothetical protein C4540_04580 [Candidatus Omnitrophota bacterium]|jgi:hypothetical protein|nr:MAG: hypothetical protein C4540_04580 [Candidatus Omnitrophota bacterium]